MLSSFWKQKPTQSLSRDVCNLVGETTITEIIHRCIRTLLATGQIKLFQTTLSCYHM